jgi:hypothetical protein
MHTALPALVGALIAASLSSAQTCCNCAGDVTGDGTVNGADLGLLLAAWDSPGTAPDFCEDVNADGNVDGGDLGLLLSNWLQCVKQPGLACGSHCADACFLPHEAPFCEDQKCCEVVCLIDSTCCEETWDEHCAEQAIYFCGIYNPEQSCCDVGTEGGCEDVDCLKQVCAQNPMCCAMAWDSSCVQLAGTLCGDLCDVDPSPGCTPANHPCTQTGPGGCSDTACCEIVCEFYPNCCDFSWSTFCVESAETLCYLDCGFECAGRTELEPCGQNANGGCNKPSVISNCCFANGLPWCDDVQCLNALCALDAFCCCVTWDTICAAQAPLVCPELCGPNPYSCCVPSGGQGCDDQPCADAVCALDPTCCSNEWDWACATLAGELCGLCADVFESEPIACGETVCGTLPKTSVSGGGFYGTQIHDEDWFALDLSAETGLTHVTMTVTTEIECILTLRSGPCDSGTAPEIDDIALDPCETGTLESLVAPGEYFIQLRASIGGPFVPCGFKNRYSLTVSCREGDEIMSCCIAHPSAGCDDASCAAEVCVFDPSCCDTAWTQSCVESAALLCEVCGAAPGDSCCAAHGSAGCAVEECERAVCGSDPFCCIAVWDEKCAEEALSICDICSGTSCCVAHESAGCDDRTCEQIVCEADSFCCEVEWDAICADAAADLCADCGGG